jgi:Fe-S cluster assembly scaffold protein SufB
MQQKEAPEILKSKGITEETVRALSSFKDEPEWLAEKRLSAWRAFEALPMPTLRDEAWRYTDISDVRIEDFLPYARARTPRARATCPRPSRSS